MIPNVAKFEEKSRNLGFEALSIFQSLILLQKWMLAQLTPMIQNQQLDAKRR